MNMLALVLAIIAALAFLAAILQGIVAAKQIGWSKKGLAIISMCIVVTVILGYASYSASSPQSDTSSPPSHTTTTLNTPSRPTVAPSPTPTPRVIPENRNIPCISCGGDYAITLKVNTITIDYANQQIIMKYTLTNIGTVSCNLMFDTLEFQDENGTIFKAQNVGQSIVDIGVGNSFIANSTFDLVPRPNTHYLLSAIIKCTNRIDFKTQDFVFS